MYNVNGIFKSREQAGKNQSINIVSFPAGRKRYRPSTGQTWSHFLLRWLLRKNTQISDFFFIRP